MFGVALLAMPLTAMLPRSAALPVLVASEFVVSFSVLVYNITQVTMRAARSARCACSDG